jgi:DNA helicase-2/ATP-dependent DNA helicase PcrA
MKLDAHEAFNISYKRLNATQKEAVDSIEGPVMVIAGPGTGKTTILTLRIANILKQTDTPAHGILAITYTDAGVKAMRAKLHDIIGNRAHEVAIHTFHSFASAMIAEYQDHFLHLEGLRHMSDVEQESLARAVIAEPKFSDIHPIGKPDAYIPAIMSSIDAAKREALTPEMVRQYAAKEIVRIKNDDDSISTRGASKGKLKAEAQDRIEKYQRTLLFADVFEAYEEKKLAVKKMDFNDLIWELLKALRNDQLLLRLIQERFLYLMVDEHQDTNDAQNFIIALIAEFFETPNIFIVGDEKQAIYRFQGASVENFLLLRKHWPAMKVISLDTNYRSHQGILDASFAMIENNYEGNEHKDLRVELKSGGKDKPRPIEIVTGENTAAIEKYLVDELRAIIGMNAKAEETGTAIKTVAIITRRNRDLERIIRLLESNHIPVSSERSVDIFHHPVGSIFFDLIEYLADPSKNDALGRTLAAGMWDLSFEESAKLIKSLRSGQYGRQSGAREHARQASKHTNQSYSLENKIPALIHLQRKALNDGAVGFIINAAEESGFTGLVARDPAYIHVWRGIVALAESLAREGDIQSPAELMKAMLAYRLSAESKTVKVSVGAPDLPIQAMTAHGSKGLEFDYVFMPYATEEAWIGRSRGSSFILPEKKTDDHSVKDIRRLFYVALTRAKKHAVILSALEESDGRALTPLRFIAELDSKSVANIELPRAEGELPRQHPEIPGEGTLRTRLASAKSDFSADDSAESPLGKSRVPESDVSGCEYSTKMIGLAKEVLLDTGLSVTALNHFLECPNKFLYLSVLKLPQAPSAAAEKGTAMHEAISRVWQDDALSSVDKAEDRVARIRKIIEETVTEYLDASFLPANEKEAVKKELFEDAPAVAKALPAHFALGAHFQGKDGQKEKGTVFTERWVKTVFEGVSKDLLGKNQRIAIPIHGKLDAIVESGDEVLVFDYKTRQAMSINKIKGETKSASRRTNGDYFRQLVFYKLLLTGESRWKNRKVTPSLVFISPDDKGRCPTITLPITAEDVETVKKQIQSVIDGVWSGSIATAKCADPACEWCGLMQAST